MNDMTRRNGNWSTSAQQNCPNCRQPMDTAQNRNTPDPQVPFLSRGVQDMITGGPTMSPQFPAQESTSNYADLGLAPMAASGTNGMTQAPGIPRPMAGAVTITPQNQAQLQSLVGNMPSAAELPGLTAINTQNQLTAYGAQNLQYLNGFLITQIGRSVTVTFLIGSNSMDVRSGTLVGVGANYILINEFESDDVVACDFYSIKFVKIYY